MDRIDEQINEISKRIREIKIQKDAEIEIAILENINFDKDKMYFYKCNGSGYYLKYSHVALENVIFDIYSKGGIKKEKQFRINWYSVGSVKARD